MNRPLHGWLAAEGVSLVGTRVSMVALPFFVLTTTGSPLKTGLVALAEMVPLVVLKVLGGPLIDRTGARRIGVRCDLGSVVVVGAIPVLDGVGRLPFPLFLALVAVAGALRGPGDAAKSSLTPVLAHIGEVPMERVTGLHSAVERTASMLGAAVAGALVAAIGPANALMVDALSFGLSAALLAWAVPVSTVPVEPDGAREHYAEQLREGWMFLRADPVLIGITVMVSLTNLIDLAYAAVLVPVWAIDSGRGAAAVGALFATWASASAVGSLVAAGWGARMPRYVTYLVCFLIAGLPRFVVLALDPALALVLAVAALGGLASGFLNPILGAVTFERVPAPLVGRVGSLQTAASFALMPLGGLLGGGLVEGVGIGAALLACGAAYFVVTMLPALDRRWQEIERRPVPAIGDATRPATRDMTRAGTTRPGHAGIETSY